MGTEGRKDEKMKGESEDEIRKWREKWWRKLIEKWGGGGGGVLSRWSSQTWGILNLSLSLHKEVIIYCAYISFTRSCVISVYCNVFWISQNKKNPFGNFKTHSSAPSVILPTGKRTLTNQLANLIFLLTLQPTHLSSYLKPSSKPTHNSLLIYSYQHSSLTSFSFAPTDEFELPTGLFLMLGFSRTEEALLFNATKGSAVDALVSLQSLFKEVAAGMGVSIAIYFTFSSHCWLLWDVEVESDGV